MHENYVLTNKPVKLGCFSVDYVAKRKMVKFKDAQEDDILLIQQLAEQTWWPTYSPILSAEQIRYMLNTIYSVEALLKSMRSGTQKFILLQDENGFQAFASYGERPDEPHVYKIHKLYVLPNNQGKGYGKMLIEEIKKRMLAIGIHILDLNVNRYNPAFTFYQKLGFKVISEEDIPIGPYWMNDYAMRIEF